MEAQEPTQLDLDRENLHKLLPVATMVLGPEQAKILEFSLIPRTTREIATACNIHYQTARKHVTSLLEWNMLVGSTHYAAKQGRLYQTNSEAVNRYLAASTVGQHLISMDATMPTHLLTKTKPARTENYRELPEPTDALPLKVGKISTNIWKFLVGNVSAESKGRQMMGIATSAIFHVWYRSYLHSEDSVAQLDLPGPTELETKELLKSIREDMLAYTKALTSVIENDQFFQVRPGLDSWKFLGDFPVYYTKQHSDTFRAWWDAGEIGTNGINHNINDDYREIKVRMDHHLNIQYMKNQKGSS